ncbi:MAG: hypothetical protein IPM66_16875 [Acidobacteriota bacterium]|nr:MAG: hypothetical protein IPM66_16875 [Acidobacteriota bacterium]
MLEHRTHFIDSREELIESVGWLDRASAFALDIETINWWDRAAERVSLLQLALRMDGIPVVLLVDTLAGIDLDPLRRPLELGMQVKAIHNASFDAIKLMRHYGIATSPIHDTMLAARRSGEKHCSLKAQAEKQLGVTLDKGEQRGDWGRRPLTSEQLSYAALDALCTLLLYEKQTALGLEGDYQLKPHIQRGTVIDHPEAIHAEYAHAGEGLAPLAAALLGIVAELDGRYSPEQLTASVGSERIGLAGWLIDRHLGSDADVDDRMARQAIEDLCAGGLVRISDSRRLEATTEGRQAYRRTGS